MGISNTIPPSRLIQPGVVANTAARPTSPFTGQAIYQVDTNQMLIWNGTAWTPPPNMPWGVMALATNTTALQAGITAETDLTGMTVTFTAVANRNYKVSFHVYAFPTVTNACFSVYLKEGATILQIANTNGGVATAGTTASAILVRTFTAGSHTLKLAGQLTGGSTGSFTFNAAAVLPWILVVEDVGPA